MRWRKRPQTLSRLIRGGRESPGQRTCQRDRPFRHLGRCRFCSKSPIDIRFGNGGLECPARSVFTWAAPRILGSFPARPEIWPGRLTASAESVQNGTEFLMRLSDSVRNEEERPHAQADGLRSLSYLWSPDWGALRAAFGWSAHGTTHRPQTKRC